MKKLLVVMATAMFFLIACSEETVNLDGEAHNYEELMSKIEDKETELKDLEKDITDGKNELSDIKNSIIGNKAKYEGLEELASNRDKMESDVKTAEETLASLNKDISTAEKELAKLKGDILEVAGSPIEISAGQWFVGSDIPPGRYQASGSSNFVVRDSGGSLLVNTILGDGGAGRGDYVFFASDGDYIEASAKTTLTPVE